MRNIKLFFVSSFFSNSYFERGIWIIYLLDNGYNMAEVGILQLILNLSSSIAEIPAGIFTDIKGKKKALAYGNIIIASYLILFLFPSNFYFLVFGHILYGIGLSLFSGTDEAFIYDTLLNEKRADEYAKYFGKYSAISTISLSIAMIIGGWLQSIMWVVVFMTGIICKLIAFIVILFIKEEKPKKEYDNTSENTKEQNVFYEFSNGIKVLFRQKFKIIFLIFALGLFFSSMSVFYMYNQALFEEVGIPTAVISIIFGLMGIVEAIASNYTYKLKKVGTNKKIINFSFFVIFISLLVFMIGTKISILLTFFITSLLYEIVDTVSSEQLNNELKSEYRATILSILGLITSLLMAILFPFIGFLSEFYGLKNSIFCVTIISIILCISAYKIFNKSIKTHILGSNRCGN